MTKGMIAFIVVSMISMISVYFIYEAVGKTDSMIDKNNQQIIICEDITNKYNKCKIELESLKAELKEHSGEKCVKNNFPNYVPISASYLVPHSLAAQIYNDFFLKQAGKTKTAPCLFSEELPILKKMILFFLILSILG